jgi:hypothetical protein
LDKIFFYILIIYFFISFISYKWYKKIKGCYKL